MIPKWSSTYVFDPHILVALGAASHNHICSRLGTDQKDKVLSYIHPQKMCLAVFISTKGCLMIRVTLSWNSDGTGWLIPACLRAVYSSRGRIMSKRKRIAGCALYDMVSLKFSLSGFGTGWVADVVLGAGLLFVPYRRLKERP
jgi:hypothetical protein